MKPLEGVRVLDFSQFLSGPFCTMIMADMGAEVIKLERPLTGDVTRWSPLQVGPTSTYFVSCNRGKKSVMMDLSDPVQKEVFFKMVKDADVLVENYKPGTMDKLGCGYETLKEINPKLIYTAVSGFGQTGPWAKKPALDLIIQAASGLMSITGEKGREPQKVGTSISDITSGLYACIGTMMALYSREKNGEGQYVDVSMLESIVSILEAAVTRYYVNGKIPAPNGNRHVAAAPFQPFKVKGGDLVFICVVSDDQWLACSEALGHPEWAEDPRFGSVSLRTDEVETIDQMVSEVVKDMTAEELCAKLEEKKVVYGQINNIEQVVNHPQIVARKAVVDVNYPGAQTFHVPGSAIRMSGFEYQTSYTASTVGEHTLDIVKPYVDDKTLDEYYKPLMEKVTAAVSAKQGK